MGSGRYRDERATGFPAQLGDDSRSSWRVDSGATLEGYMLGDIAELIDRELRRIREAIDGAKAN